LRALLVLLAMLALLATTSIAAPFARAASSSPQLKAVLIVGPSGMNTENKSDADLLASQAAAYGMDVVKLYTPHATWDAVLANIQGANLVVYWGHGNGWPSPYTPFQEKTKDGFGLNASDGSSSVAYYGGNKIRNNIVLAPNAIVGLSHACYTSGNWEPGMAIPSYDTARQDVDNYAAAFLYAGARAVFALETGQFGYVLDGLFQTDKTVDQIFSTPGAGGLAYYGFVGWNDKYFDSQRMPGFTNHLDPEQDAGYRRALTGDMNMTAADWMSGASSGGGGGGGGTGTKPTVSAPSASFVTGSHAKGKVDIHLDWDASPSPNVVAYDLQVSMDGGSWTAVALAAPTALSADAFVKPNHDYQFRLRATDSSATVGDWVTTTSRTLGRVQENSSALSYSGPTWSPRKYMRPASGKYVVKDTTSGDSVSYTFDGTYVGFVSTEAAKRGKAEVWLDGSKVATLDLYSPTKHAAMLVWSADVSAGSHTVEVVMLGTKNASSGSTRVDVDAFLTWQ
jgi:hypothetical protein